MASRRFCTQTQHTQQKGGGVTYMCLGQQVLPTKSCYVNHKLDYMCLQPQVGLICGMTAAAVRRQLFPTTPSDNYTRIDQLQSWLTYAHSKPTAKHSHCPSTVTSAQPIHLRNRTGIQYGVQNELAGPKLYTPDSTPTTKQNRLLPQLPPPPPAWPSRHPARCPV